MMESTSIMERLRSETLADHKAAESHPLQHALALGTLPRGHFCRHLGQLLHVHRTLDGALRRLADSTPAIPAVVGPEQFQTPYLEEDLAFLDPSRLHDAPLPATATLLDAIDRIAREEPEAVLGLHYVLEGSNNGSKFLARVVQRAYGLEPGPGTRYLDPYGDRQRELWARFKADMNGVAFTPAQCDRIVVAARLMFRAIGAIGDDLLMRHPLPEAVAGASH